MTAILALASVQCRPRQLDQPVRRKLDRLVKQFPECGPMLRRVERTMAMENPTWNEQHAAAMYARLLTIMLSAMAVLKGESRVPEVVTGWEGIVDEFFAARVGVTPGGGTEAA